MSEIFQRLIDLSLKRHLPMQVFIGQVESVDIDTQTCTVVREGAPKLFDVRLNATIAEYTDRLILKPKLNSSVLLAIIENDVNEAFLLACSEIEEISLNIEEQSLLINKEGFVFNEGNWGGLIKIEELKTQLEKLTARVDGVIDALKKSKPAVGSSDGGKAYVDLVIAALAPFTESEDYSEIEDDKVKH